MSCCSKCQLAGIEKEADIKRLLKICTSLFLAGSFIFIGVFLVSLIWSICDTDFYEDKHLSNLLKWKDWIECAGGCFTLWIISYNLEKFIDAETVKALGDLRTKFNEEHKRDIHRELIIPTDTISCYSNTDNNRVRISEYHADCKILGNHYDKMILDIDVYDYLGIIELGVIMLKRGVISYEEFLSQFGYRVNNLWRDDRIRDCIEREKECYSDLLDVIHIMEMRGDYLV